MADAYKDYKNPADFITKANIQDLTDIAEDFGFGYVADTYVTDSPTKAMYKITKFAYYSDEYKQTAKWSAADGKWEVVGGNKISEIHPTVTVNPNNP